MKRLINNIFIIFIVFGLLALPYIRRVYLINMYPDGIPNYGSTTVFIIIVILISLIQLKNRYYPPKITIFQRLMANTMFYEIVMFLYNGLQTTYYKPLKDLNTYMLQFNFYKSLRLTVANIYIMNRRFRFKTFKLYEFISYIVISIMPLSILLILVVYPYLMFNVYSIKGMSLFSISSLFTKLSKIWYGQFKQEIEELINTAENLVTIAETKLKTLDEYETLIKETKDDIMLHIYTLEYQRVNLELKKTNEQTKSANTKIKHMQDKWYLP